MKQSIELEYTVRLYEHCTFGCKLFSFMDTTRTLCNKTFAVLSLWFFYIVVC